MITVVRIVMQMTLLKMEHRKPTAPHHPDGWWATVRGGPGCPDLSFYVGDSPVEGWEPGDLITLTLQKEPLK